MAGPSLRLTLRSGSQLLRQQSTAKPANRMTNGKHETIPGGTIMVLLFAEVAEHLQTAYTVRTTALVLLMIFGGLVGLSLFYGSLVKHPRQRRALGTVRLRLPVVSSASVRERKPSRKFLFVGIGVILAGVVFPLTVGSDSTLPERLGLPFFYVSMSCVLAQQFGRRDHQRWLAVLGSLCFCGVAAGALAAAISGRWQQWAGANPTVELLFAYGLAVVLCVMSVGSFWQTLNAGTLVTDDGIDFGSMVLRWNDLRRYEWHDDGDDCVVVLTIPSPGSALFQLIPLPEKTADRLRDRRDFAFMLPVPSEHREQMQDILDKGTPQTSDAPTDDAQAS